MKKIKDNFFLILIVLISLVYLIPIIQPGFFIGHDNVSQVARTAARIKALTDGQMPPRWAGDLNYGYGHPGLIFFYSLSGYLGSFLYFLGISLEDGYEFLMGATFVLSAIFFYLWASQFLKKEIAFVSALFYGLEPYSFLDVFVRAHLGESLGLVFIPLVLYSIERNLKKPSFYLTIFGGIAQALFIHSHSILSFMFIFVFFGYILLRGLGNKKVLVYCLGILAIGILLSAYFWIPALSESRYINSKIFLSDWYKGHFLNLSNIIYSKWGFGSNVNEPGGLSAQIGPLHFLFSILSVLILIKKRKEWIVVLFWLSIFVLGVFMSMSFSDFLWSRIHFLQQFQFPWRFIAITSFSASVLTGYTLQIFNSRKLLIASLIILLVLGIPMAKVWKNESKGDAYYFNYPGTAAYHNEATTIWVEGDAYEYPKDRIELIAGEGKILKFKRKSNLHTLTVDSKTNVKILDNTVYFPGWQVFVDGKKTPIEFQDVNHRGLITFSVPKGMHHIEVVFKESAVRLFSNMVSLFSIIGIFLIFVVRLFFSFARLARLSS